MSRDFEKWLATFRNSINGYKYYVDFEKVYENAKKLKVEINILNSLVGSDNIEAEFTALLQRYPECLKAIPILLAVRENEIYCQDAEGAFTYKFDEANLTIEQYQIFMKKTGLFDMLQKHIINNLYDYVTGVEVGLSSNGRKNRGGHQMEELVKTYLEKANVVFCQEMDFARMEKEWNVDLSSVSVNGMAKKVWDFVVKTQDTIYVIETNFYTSSGSKLNETARSYIVLAEGARSIPNFKFVWITDGKGWFDAKRNLKETFDQLPDLYNIADMENNIFEKLFNKR